LSFKTLSHFAALQQRASPGFIHKIQWVATPLRMGGGTIFKVGARKRTSKNKKVFVI